MLKVYEIKNLIIYNLLKILAIQKKMDLFGNQLNQPISLINEDGDVQYFGNLLSFAEADDYFNKLMNHIEWL